MLQILPLLTRLVTHMEDLVAFTMAWYRADRAAPASCELEKMDMIAWSPTVTKESIQSWQQLEKATNKKSLWRVPMVPLTVGVREARPAPAMLQSRIYLSHSLPVWDWYASCPRSTFSFCKERWGTPQVPLLCVSEVRGEGGLMGSGFEHVLV